MMQRQQRADDESQARAAAEQRADDEADRNNLRQNYVVYAVRRTTNKDSHGIPR